MSQAGDTPLLWSRDSHPSATPKQQQDGFGEFPFPSFSLSHPRGFLGKVPPSHFIPLWIPHRRGIQLGQSIPKSWGIPQEWPPWTRRGWKFWIPTSPHPGTPFPLRSCCTRGFSCGERSLAEPAGCPAGIYGRGLPASPSPVLTPLPPRNLRRATRLPRVTQGHGPCVGKDVRDGGRAPWG